ncbi:MAG: inorganic phosphate transporter [Candidatus Gracilibacteria bacterium]
MTQEIFLLLSGLYLAWSLGANDVSNVVSTAVGSKTISVHRAVLFFVLFALIGLLFLSGPVVRTVSSGIVPAELMTIPHAIIVLFTAAAWIHFATWRKWSVSASESIISGVMGVGLAEGLKTGMDLVHWPMVLKMVGVWFFSPFIGFLVGWILFKIFHGFVRHRHLYFSDAFKDFCKRPFCAFCDWFSGNMARRERFFKGILLLSMGYMALAFGASTLATTAGVLHSGVMADGGILSFDWDENTIFVLMKVSVIFAMVVGVLTYGKGLIDLLGSHLLKLNPLRGAVIQTAAATVIMGAALMGYPVSSTGIFIGAFLGVNRGDDHSHLKSHAAAHLKMAFLVTIPVTAVVAGLLTWAW